MMIRLVLGENLGVSQSPQDQFPILPKKWLIDHPKLESFHFTNSVVQSSAHPRTFGSNTFFSDQASTITAQFDSVSMSLPFLTGAQLVYDSIESSVTLYAHPLGRGTFFYTELHDQLFVSTSLVDVSALLSKVSLCREMVAEYLLFLRCTSGQQDLTFIEGVYQIPAGHCLVYQNGQHSIQSYWSPVDEAGFEVLSISDAAENVRNALRQTLVDQDLPNRVGCLVSGGLDSSVVAAAVKAIQTERGGHIELVTFRSGLDSPEEHNLQQILANHLQLPLTTLSLPLPRLQLARLREINHWSNVPSGGIFTGIYQDIVEQCRDRNISVLLGGEGGDEVFSANSLILADYLRTKSWRSLVEGIGFFSSIYFDVDSLSTFIDSAVLPMLRVERSARNGWLRRLLLSVWQNTSEHRTSDFLATYIGSFSGNFKTAQMAYTQDLHLQLQRGFSFASYQSYRQVIEMPNYEIRGAQSDAAIFNPLGSVRVFNAAMSLKLHERIGTWIGFRPKHLLSLAAGTDLPPAIALHPKIGRSALLAQVTLGVEDEAANLLSNSTFGELGIQIPDNLRDPRNVPVNVSLYWSWLLRLSIWIEEFKKRVSDYGSVESMDSTGTVGDI